MFYLIRSGCCWRLPAKDIPPFATVHNLFYAWRDSGLEAGGPRGFDAGKKIKGRRRHVAVDTPGQFTPADVRDRDAMALEPLLRETHRKSPFVTMCFVDSGYNGDEAQRAAFETSRKGFIVLPSARS
jgi:hypothetical protein